MKLEVIVKNNVTNHCSISEIYNRRFSRSVKIILSTLYVCYILSMNTVSVLLSLTP